MFNTQEVQTIEAAKAILANALKTTDTALTNPSATKTFCQLEIAGLEHEVFGVLLLNNQHQLIKFEIMFRGTIDGASVYPREVAKAALLNNAAAVIFTHNHPSGITEPSQADRRITERLSQALELLDIRTLDHIIVGPTETTSFAERGLL